MCVSDSCTFFPLLSLSRFLIFVAVVVIILLIIILLSAVYIFEILIAPDIILFKKIILAFEYKEFITHISIQNTIFNLL
jgi:hypothetical protein